MSEVRRRLVAAHLGCVTPLNYIETDGSQYIDLGFAPNYRTAYSISVAKSNTTQTMCICGTRTGTTTNSSDSNCVFITSQDRLRYDYYGQTKSYNKNISSTAGTTTIVAARNYCRAMCGTNQISEVSTNTSTNSSTNNLFLFMLNQNGTAQSGEAFRGKFFGMTVFSDYNSGAVLHNYIPAMDTSGNVGIYDTIDKVMIYKSAGNDFTCA